MLRMLKQRVFEKILVEIVADQAVKAEAPRGGPWRLAIEQPSMLRGEARLVVSLTDQGLVTSGEYRNFYELDGERFSHKIGRASCRERVERWVVAVSCREKEEQQV